MRSPKNSPKAEDDYSFDAQNEFVKRTTGNLPETINEADLETLNTGLHFLFADLREAKRRFEAEADGRKGAFTALGALWRFIVLFQAAYAETLHVSILRLQDALGKLEENAVLPMVRPRRRPGHPPSSHAHATVRGNAVATLKVLSENGIDRSEACRQVAEVLKRLGMRPTRGRGKITARTVDGWCEEVAEDVGRHGTVAMACDSALASMRPKISTLPQDEVRHWALGSLAHVIQTLFPKTHTGHPENPPNPP